MPGMTKQKAGVKKKVPVRLRGGGPPKPKGFKNGGGECGKKKRARAGAKKK